MNRQPFEPRSEPHSELRFGRFRLQPMQRQLFENDVPVKLGGRAFDVLWALVERRDRAVPKSELMQLAWPKRVVEENNLQVQVVTLRKLLGPAAITTIPGRGYQFMAALDGAIQPAPAQAAVESALSTTEPPTNLPAQLQPLYGRDEDLARLSELIEQHLLVSVVGPSGIGKTRIAKPPRGALGTTSPTGSGWSNWHRSPTRHSQSVPLRERWTCS